MVGARKGLCVGWEAKKRLSLSESGPLTIALLSVQWGQSMARLVLGKEVG